MAFEKIDIEKIDDHTKTTRDIDFLVVHCTATPQGRWHDARDIDLWHKRRGFAGIGYNFVVKLNGDIEKGRDLDATPAHVAGYNTRSIGIVYVGGVDKNTLKSKDTRTEAQKRSLEALLRALRRRYPKAKIWGHRDFPGVRKACPCFDAKREYEKI